MPVSREAVARAIGQAKFPEDHLPLWVWLADHGMDVRDLDDLALAAIRAVIEGLMEPSEEMVHAAHEAWRKREAYRLSITGGSGDVAHPGWETYYLTAMLRAELARVEKEAET